MTLTEYPDLVQGSEEWLEARRGLVTASVVGTWTTGIHTMASLQRRSSSTASSARSASSGASGGDSFTSGSRQEPAGPYRTRAAGSSARA